MRTSKLSDKKGWGVVSGARRGEGSSFTGLGSSLRACLYFYQTYAHMLQQGSPTPGLRSWHVRNQAAQQGSGRSQ